MCCSDNSRLFVSLCVRLSTAFFQRNHLFLTIKVIAVFMILLFDVMLSYLLNPYWKPLCTECVDLFCDNVGHLFSMYWERLHTFIQWQLARCSFLWWHTGHTSLLIIIATWPKGNIWQRTSKVACSASTFTMKTFKLFACLTCSACFLLCICNVQFDLYAAQQLLPLSNSTQFGRAVQFTAVRDSYLGLFGTNHQPTPVTKISRSAQNAPFQL